MFAAFHASAAFSFALAPAHSNVSSAGSQGTLGSVVSSIVKVAVLDLSFPHSSVIVNVTTVATSPQNSVGFSKSVVHTTSPQTSDDTPPPLLSNQA